jgi:hypothetical protein
VNSTLGRWWHAFVRVVGDFLDECAFRGLLAFDVILGRLPLEVEKRWWSRGLETPVLIDVCDWTTERRLFSVLVWPSLESPPDDAASHHRQRVDAVKSVIARGGADMAWCVHFETDYSLRWDNEREVWTARDGFAYDGKKTHDAA